MVTALIVDLIVGTLVPLGTFFYIIKKDIRQSLLFTVSLFFFLTIGRIATTIFGFDFFSPFISDFSLKSLLGPLILGSISIYFSFLLIKEKIDLKKVSILIGIIYALHLLIWALLQDRGLIMFSII